MGIFSGLKNAAVSEAVKKFLSDYLERYGELQDFNIDPEAKQITLKFLPKGENDPVSVLVADYNLVQSRSGYFFKAEKAESNREWISRLLQDFLVNKSIQMPNEYYSYIKLLL